MNKDYGFIRVAACVPETAVAQPRKNAERIKSLIDRAVAKDTSLIVFPELSITGYTCADLFTQELLISGAESAVRDIADHIRGKNCTVVVGAPVSLHGCLYNCGVVLRDGKVLGIVPKTYLPAYSEFYESRWFKTGGDFLGDDSSTAFYAGETAPISPNLIFNCGKVGFAVELCEDLWTPIPPSSYHAVSGALITLNLSASNETVGKAPYRRNLVAMQSAKTISGYVYCSAGYGESTQDLVYSGAAIVAEYGHVLAENERLHYGESLLIADIDAERLENLRRKSTSFKGYCPDGRYNWRSLYRKIDAGKPADTDFSKELLHHIDAHPFIPSGNSGELDRRCREILDIQVEGLATRLSHIDCKNAVIGISGGLDSTLALIVTAMAFDKLGLDRKGITGVTMPGYGTTGRTRGNAVDLMESLGISSREISIVAACDQHFKDIGHDKNVHDVTYENSQARERTQILMDVANQTGGIVVGTGDLSELALGWATYNGDHMSMYAVNASVPKTLVRYLVKWAAENRFAATVEGCRSIREILLDIVDTPVSPELLPADENGKILQVTEDLVGPYELHDFFLYNLQRFGLPPKKIFFLACKAFDGIYDVATIEKWLRTFLRRFFSQQFKRSCLPDGPKVGSISLSPRGDWRMPSDSSSAEFLEDLD